MFSLGKKSTLIVEDFAEFARSLRAMLHPLGATSVDIVSNAEDAIEACKSKKYDIILSDYNLGQRKDGQQLLEELIKHRLIKSNNVFLMLTAENTTAMVMGAVEYQPDGYIAKPFNGNLLLSRLKKAIEKKDSLQPINKALIGKKWLHALDQIELTLPKYPKYKMSCLRLRYKALKGLSRYDDALKLVTEINSQRSIPWVIEAVGELFYLKNDLVKAQEIFKNMLQEFPMALEGYDWLAKIQKKLGNPIDAQETLIKAVEKSPKALQRQKMLGSLAEENNDIDRMTTAYRNAVKYSKNSAFAEPDEYLQLTKAISKQISRGNETTPNKLIKEAEATFANLDKNFIESKSKSLRNHVAQATFYTSIKQQDKSQLHIAKSEKYFSELDEQLSAEVSLELSESLTNLGKSDLAEEILNKAIEQNLDNPDFIEKATKMTNNKELIKISQQTNQYNNKAIHFFKNKQYKESSQWFEKAHSLSPNNINIRLNYVQTLLKITQASEQSKSIIDRAEKLISNMPQLSFSDSRYARYSELSRLVQLMKQR